MLKLFFFSLAMALLCVPRSGSDQHMLNQPLQAHQLSPAVFWVEGGGGNSTVIVGDKGVIVVDAKTDYESGKHLITEIGRITPKPITTVLLTHRDMDHIGGLSAFPNTVEIIAQQVDAGFEAPMPPGGPHPRVVAPTQVLTGKMTKLSIDGVTFELLHWAPAHTSGDLIVYLPDQKIVVAGDILDSAFATGHIHMSQHGSSAGWIETVRGILGLDADRYIPGHGSVEDRQAVETHLDLAVTERARVAQLIAQGSSLAEIQAAVNDPPADRPNASRDEAFSTVVYRELTALHDRK